MHSRQKKKFQSYRRIQGWLITHLGFGASDTPAGDPMAPPAANATGIITPSAIAVHSAALDAVVRDVETFAGEQEAQDRAAEGAAAEALRLRNDLENQMRDVAIMAGTAMPDVVRMTAALRRPVARDAEGIMAAAEAMAMAASSYEELLVQRGLPGDFIDGLRNAAAAFKQAIDARGAAIGRRHRAVQSLAEAFKQGGLVVDALDVLVKRRYRDDKGTLAEWKQVKRVTQVGARSAADTSIVTTPTALQPSPEAISGAAV